MKLTHCGINRGFAEIAGDLIDIQLNKTALCFPL